MTDQPDRDLLKPSGWTVMETDTGDLLLLPVWFHRDSDGEMTTFIAHPGGVVVDDTINPSIADLRHSARCVLAACLAVSQQRVRGQEAVRELLERHQPADDSRTLEDLIAEGMQAAKDREAERTRIRSEDMDHVSQLFADLKNQIDRLNKDKPQDGDQS